MNPVVLLASALLLQPVLDADMDLRLVASGTGGHPVHWYLDGERVATTTSGEATTVAFAAGSHDVWATTEYDGTWRALARPTGPVGGGQVGYVDGWSAAHEAETGPGFTAAPVILALAGFGVAAWGRFRPKRP